MPNSCTDIKFVDGLDYASGTADRNGATVDMAGWTGVLMFVKFATIAADAVTLVRAQQGAASDMSDAADLANAAISVPDSYDNQVFCLNVYQPEERYVRVKVDKDATHATAEVAWYILYGPSGHGLPTLESATPDFNYELHFAPPEGTPV